MASPPPAQVGAQAETNETNEVYTNEVYDNNQVYSNEPGGGGKGKGKGKRRRRKFEKPPETVIDRVQSAIGNQPSLETKDVILAPEVDAFVRLKLVEWDADQSGTFSREEVAAAMDELRGAEERTHQLKWNLMLLFLVICLFIGATVGTIIVVLSVTKQTGVQETGAMTATIPDSKPKQKALIETTQQVEEGILTQLLESDPTTDQWLIPDDQLRDIEEATFKTTNGAFYKFDVAEIIRIDSGRDGGNDQVNILTIGGHSIRMWETLPNIEVKWMGTNMWECLDPQKCGADDSGGRLLGENDLLDEFDMNPGDRLWIAGDVRDVDELGKNEPPRRQMAKGGVMVGSHHGRGHYGGGSRCQGQCNVPKGSKECCSKFCANRACYSHYDEKTGKTSRYQCDHGRCFAEGVMMHLLCPVIAWLMYDRNLQL